MLRHAYEWTKILVQGEIGDPLNVGGLFGAEDRCLVQSGLDVRDCFLWRDTPKSDPQHVHEQKLFSRMV